MAGRLAPSEVTVSPATLDDLDEIMVIERAAFTVPWTRHSIAEEISRPWSIFRVLRNGDGQLLAYLNFWVVQDELHILNIATHPAHRRQGYAGSLLDQLLEDARLNATAEILLEVRRSNTAAKRLYEGLNFERVGVRAGYYGDSGEDALVYRLKPKPE